MECLQWTSVRPPEDLRLQSWPSYLQVDHPRHHQCSHEQVSHSKADDQVVGGGLQGFLLGHSHADQHVAKDDHKDEERQQHGIVVIVGGLLLQAGAIEGPVFIAIIVPEDIWEIHGEEAPSVWTPD